MIKNGNEARQSSARTLLLHRWYYYSILPPCPCTIPPCVVHNDSPLCPHKRLWRLGEGAWQFDYVIAETRQKNDFWHNSQRCWWMQIIFVTSASCSLSINTRDAIAWWIQLKEVLAERVHILYSVISSFRQKYDWKVFIPSVWMVQSSPNLCSGINS